MAKHQTLLKNILFFVVIWLHCCIALLVPSESLLLVVGDVTESSARVLLQSFISPINELPLFINVFSISDVGCSNSNFSLCNNRTKLLSTSVELPALNFPSVFKFIGLTPSTKFIIGFSFSQTDGNDDVVSFKTLPLASADIANKSNNIPLKIVFVSCDRWVEDDDSSFLEVLTRNEGDRFGMFHMGDQIYADVLRTHIGNRSHTVVEFLAQFRRLYQLSWSRPLVQKMLRLGAHFMLPDDHDIINNLDPRMLVSLNRGQSEGFPVSPDATREEVDKDHNNYGLRALIFAGRQAFMEYQFQLTSDWSAEDDLLAMVKPENDASSATPKCSLQSLHPQFDPVVCRRGNTLEIHVSVTPDDKDNQATGGDHVIDSTAGARQTRSDDSSVNPFPIYGVRRFGAAAILFMDLRFERTFHSKSDSSLLGETQMRFVQSQMNLLQNDITVSDIIVVSSIPLLFHANAIADIAEQAENERYATEKSMRNETSYLLGILFPPSSSIEPIISHDPVTQTFQKLRLLVAGDMHMFADSEICLGYSPLIYRNRFLGDPRDEKHCFGQLVTSGLSRGSVTGNSIKLWLFNFVNSKWFAPTLAAPTPRSSLVNMDHIESFTADTAHWSLSWSYSWIFAGSIDAVQAARINYELNFRQFYFGYNYGVVLLPSSTQNFTFDPSVFLPLPSVLPAMYHPPASSNAASKNNHVLNRVSYQSLGDWTLSLGDAVILSQFYSQGPHAAANLYEFSKSPSQFFLTSVRSPIRRNGNIVWLAEVGVPMEFRWLLLQLLHDNIINFSATFSAACIGIFALAWYSRSFVDNEDEHARMAATTHNKRRRLVSSAKKQQTLES